MNSQHSLVLQHSLLLNERTGRYHARRGATPEEVLQTAQTILAARLQSRPVFKDPASIRQHLLAKLASLPHEEFAVLFLDTQHRLIASESLFRGTIDGCSVYPREVVKAVLRHNAAAVVFSHNHPSGVAEPSAADRTLTERLKSALAQIDVRVLDHFVVGGTNCVSFAERGWL